MYIYHEFDHCQIKKKRGILEIGHDFFQPSRDRCNSELLLEIRHRMDFYTEIGTNSKYYSRSTQIGSLQDLRPEIGAF